MRLLTLLVGLVLLSSTQAIAQSPDSLETALVEALPQESSNSAPIQTEYTNYHYLPRYTLDGVDTVSLSPKLITPHWKPNSGRAMLWAILPGGGQIYNRKYWKLPIVWGAFLTTFYAIRFNQKMYGEYHTAYRDLMSADPATNTAWLAFAPKGAKAEDYAQYERLKGTLKRGNDYYRRYRDISIVAGVLVYALSVLDAYVDAELFTFDISEDLSMEWRPQFTPASMSGGQFVPQQVGVLCSLSF